MTSRLNVYFKGLDLRNWNIFTQSIFVQGLYWLHKSRLTKYTTHP